MEVYKDVKGYEGLYQVSNLGNVKSLSKTILCKDGKYKSYNEKILKPLKQTIGYRSVCLYKNKRSKSFLVHRLVAFAFLGLKDDSVEIVDHIDNDKTNNKLDNLQLITQRENIHRGGICKNKTSKYIGISYRQKTKRWRAAIYINGKNIEIGSSYKTELEAYNDYKTKILKYKDDAKTKQ